MKRILRITILIILLFTISACSKSDDTSYIGVNAEILEITNELQGFVVKGLIYIKIIGVKC